METVTDFLYLGSKITVDGDSSHDIRRHLLFGRKATTNLDNALKTGDITLPTKAHMLGFLQWSCSDVSVGPLRRLSARRLMFSNCGAGEDS